MCVGLGVHGMQQRRIVAKRLCCLQPANEKGFETVARRMAQQREKAVMKGREISCNKKLNIKNFKAFMRGSSEASREGGACWIALYLVWERVCLFVFACW